MKNIIIYFITIGLVITLTACGSNFKKPKTVTIGGSKGEVTVTYDDKDKYETTSSENGIALKSDKNNFLLNFNFSNDSRKKLEKQKKEYKKDFNHEVIEKVKINGYKGYAIIDKIYGTVNYYLYLNEKKDINFEIMITPSDTDKASKRIKDGTKAKNIVYTNEKAKEIINTIKLKKNK